MKINVPLKNNFLKSIVLVQFLILISISVKSQGISYAREVIDTLCSPYMAGRGYVEDGDLKAASFIANEFKTHNLKGYQNSYFQNFDVSVNTFPNELSINIDGKKLIPGIDFIIEPCSPSIEGSFDMVSLKRSWLSDEERLKQKLKKHIGKVLIIDERKLKLSTQEVHQLTRRLKSNEMGIAGIVLLTNQKLLWSVSPYECPLPQVSIKKNAVKSTKKINIQIDQAHEKVYKTQNVIGYIPGNRNPDSLIVFTAHYDHLGKMGAETIFPGANDNASGIAMLLNLVKYYSSDPAAFTVVFMAFGAEELGLVGSRYFVENPLFPLENIKFLINMDMVGTGDEGLTAVNGTVFTEHFEMLSSINEAYQLLPQIQERGERCSSDHCFFYYKGVPCFFFYTMGGIRAYHDVFDKPDTLPLTKFEETFKLIVLFTNYLMGVNNNIFIDSIFNAYER
jgi:aminopeptidase YwaD